VACLALIIIFDGIRVPTYPLVVSQLVVGISWSMGCNEKGKFMIAGIAFGFFLSLAMVSWVGLIDFQTI
jgi:hypothetical protein